MVQSDVERVLHAPNFEQPWILNWTCQLVFALVYILAVSSQILGFILRILMAIMGAIGFRDVIQRSDEVDEIDDGDIFPSLTVMHLGGGRKVDVIHYGDFATSDLVYVCIPGNPGNARYYRLFASTLHEHTGMTVMIIGHTGHSHTSRSSQLYDLEEQVDHKLRVLTALETQSKNHPQYILAGHSIGAYVCLAMLKHLPMDRVVQGHMLFPTVSHIGTTPRGMTLWPVLRFGRPAVVAIAKAIAQLPLWLRRSVVKQVLGHKAAPEMVDATLSILSPEVGANCLYMGYNELCTLLELDEECLRVHDAKLKWYFGRDDGWVTQYHANDVARICVRSEIEYCTKGIGHGFVLEHAVQKAEWIVEQWLS
eukprot:TRINITY_DN9796_c0_g1_i3.p1 TRINITY_DN9796_c0_g1~~TRINITY_DN9796_c0_g1_i3.p1  ORF type:complete len:375 (+),score=43.39 TRINITY_DN9796_c0_g1_i3:28-1125(+)